MRSRATRIVILISIFILFTFSTVYAETAITPENGPGAALTDGTSLQSGITLPSLEIKAPSAILTEAERGQILYSKNPREKLHISAACKLMTVLIAAESGKLSSNVTISSDSVDAGGSALSLEVGEKYTLENLLYGIMLTSANDAAKAVAEYIGGDTDKFVAMMNTTAAKLNMTDTHFTNPTGLFEENQYTTAYDISLLIKYALTNPSFNGVFSVKARPWDNGGNETKILTSQNKLFWSYDGVDGGKTGYNEKDRQSAVTTAVRSDMKLICIVLDTPENNLFNDSASILDYGFNNYRKSILVHSGDILKTAKLDGAEVNLICRNDASYVHPVGESWIKNFSSASFAETPVKTSKPAGTATYTLNDDTVINIDLYPEKEIVPPEDFLTTAKQKILDNRNIVYLIGFLLLLEVIFMIVYIIRFFKKLLRKIFKT